jgi:hypothetical protein
MEYAAQISRIKKFFREYFSENLVAGMTAFMAWCWCFEYVNSGRNIICFGVGRDFSSHFQDNLASGWGDPVFVEFSVF